MAIIAVSSLKGGVGKTTCALHLAHGLARAGYQTLVIDTDSAAHLSRHFVAKPEECKNGLTQLCRQPLEEIEQLITPNVRQKLDLIAYNLSSHWHDNDFNALLPLALEILSKRYRFIIIDTAPELNTLTCSVLGSASLVIIPLDESSMAIESLRALSTYLRRQSGHTENSKKAEVFALRSMLNRRASRTQALSIDALTSALNEGNLAGAGSSATGFLKELNLGLLETIIYRSELAHQLGYSKKSAFDLSANTTLAADYYSLVSELLSILAARGERDLRPISRLDSTRLSSRAQAYRGA